MKNLLIVCVSFLFLPDCSLAQSTCSEYYPFSKDCKFEITSYNRKDKVSAIVEYNIAEVTTGAEGVETAKVSSVVMDKKREVLSETEYTISCSGDKVSIDVNSMIDPAMFKQFKDMKFDVSGTNIELPNDLVLGQKLADANLLMSIDMSGLPMMMTVDMQDREVLALETITTPAGTFECFVIGYTLNVKMGITRKGNSKQWIAKGVGMVKQEDYNKKGKLMSKSLLTAFSK